MRPGHPASSCAASIARRSTLALLFLTTTGYGIAISAPARAPSPAPTPELAKHLASITSLAANSPTIRIPEGHILIGQRARG